MDHYISLLLPLESGAWRAVFPDISECEVEASSLDSAVRRAATALACHVATLNGTAPAALPWPRDLTAIKSDREWAAAHAIDWRITVITMIPLYIPARRQAEEKAREDHMKNPLS